VANNVHFAESKREGNSSPNVQREAPPTTFPSKDDGEDFADMQMNEGDLPF